MTTGYRTAFATTLLILTLALTSFAQTGAGEHKEIHAIKVTGTSLRIDGKLDDPLWKSAIFSSDFLMKEPTEGSEPGDKTEVAIAYDEKSLYIAARMYSKDPAHLRMHLDRHDNQGPAEQFIVTIDSYYDKRTGYGFGVNTAGVRFDRYTRSDNEGDRDYGYNPVWSASTSRDSVSWTCEMEIPFSQLRFKNIDKQTWGINFNRWIPSRNEDIFWVYVPRNESGFISHFGKLTGIEGIAPSRRIEVMPYVAGDVSHVDGNFKGNPFTDGNDLTSRLGGDLKMGLGPNLTLDATFNPDFGQVEADPANVNLSDFEVFFDEKRPFFVEGSELFNGNGLFYSRRIGGPPHAGGTGDYVDQPNNSTILGAAKVTGEVSKGTKIGVLTAVTQEEHARNYSIDGDSTYETLIEPATIVGVTTVQRQLGKNGQHVLSGKLVGLHRDMEKDSPVDSMLRRNAVSGAGALSMRFKEGQYNWYISGTFTNVTASKAAMIRTQRSSVRYYQRPDIDYAHVDSNRTSLGGYSAYTEIYRSSGSHWLWYQSLSAESPGLEKNDAGQLGGADDLDSYSELHYRETKPGKMFRSYHFFLGNYQSWNYGGDRQFGELSLGTVFTLANFYSGELWVSRQLAGQDDRFTRGGPSMRNLPGWSTRFLMNNNFANTTTYGFNIHAGNDDRDGWLYNGSLDFATRVGTKWKFSLSPFYQREDQPRQYVTALDTAGIGGGADTYGRRYIFSRIAMTTMSLQFRMSYFFSPTLSLEVYAEPFAASGRYHDHGELVAARGNDLRVYDDIQFIDDSTGTYYSVTDGSASFDLPYRDFGFRSFRSNMVLRWEFSPGSTAYLVWARNLSDEREVGRNVRPGALFDSFSAEGTDFVALKIAYWIPLS